MKKVESDISLIIGTMGTGKSTFVINTLKKIGARVLIVSLATQDELLRKVPEVQSQYLHKVKQGPGIYKVEMSEEMNVILTNIKTKWFNSHIIFDDFFGIVGYNPPMVIKQPIITIRHNCNPCYFMFQNLNDCAPFLYQNAARIYLFKTSKIPVDKSLNKIPRADEILRAKAYIDSPSIPNHDYALIHLSTLDPRSLAPFTHYKNTHK